MALEPAGVVLEARNYQDYTAKLAQITKLQKDAFSQNTFKDYQKASDIISKQSKQMNSSLESTWNVVQNLRSKFDDAAASGGKVNSVFDKLKGAFKPLIGDIDQLAGAVAGMLAKFTLVAGILKVATDLINFGNASVAVAQRNETLAVSLREVGTQAGYSSEQIELAVKLLNKQGITTSAAQQSLLRMTRANISWAEASKLAAIAQGSAVIAGMNSSAAFERLVTGIQKMEPELLDELGITLRRTDAYERFGATIGKNAKELTDTEKQQAILNEVYRQSESVLGVYDAAMETSGKQQASLVRLIEETQNNLGKMLLPLQANSVEMQTNFWKGAQQVTKALSGIGTQADLAIDAAGRLQGALINAAVTMFTFGQVQFDEKKTFWYRLGEGIFNFTKAGLVNIGLFVAGAKVKLEEITAAFIRTGLAIQKLAEFDPKGAFEIFKQARFDESPILKFQKHFDEFWQDVVKRNPDMAKSWDELNAAIEGTPEDLRLPPDPSQAASSTEAIEKQIEALETLRDAYKQAQDIQQNFQKANAQAEKDYQKSLADAEEKYLKERERKILEFNKKLAEFDAENARKRQQMIDDFEFNQQTRLKEFNLQRTQAEQNYNLSVKQEKRKFYDEQKRALKDFQLSMIQEQRRFQVTDRRLRAEGDILGLMEAREDFALQQQENVENFQNKQTTAGEAFAQQQQLAKENFALQEQQARDSFRLQTEIQREEFQRRLQEFDENVAIQREKMIEAHAQELADLDTKFEEEKVKLYEQYQERLALAQEQRDAQLQALGDSLKEEGKVTEEGMKEIAAKISEVFGDDAAGDQLIKGWSERSKDEINNLVDELNAEIQRLKENMESASAAVGGGGSRTGPSSYGNVPGNPNAPGFYGGGNPSGAIGARRGFSGVVVGPKTFKVEPGVREHVQMTPMSRFGGNVTVSGSTRHEIIGASSGVSENMEREIADTILSELKLAVRRVQRRN